MSIGEWYNSMLKKLNWTDIGFVKLSVAGFILMLAKLWTPLLSLEWYWYGLIGALAGAKVCWKAFVK
ncbi:hypothetical protein CMO89_00050 [Candidatus Woesearchaeota archaeon]|nr:hypothetical protein [Candidatus Woesearchaeota archaeon]|tara:strand:+ start:2148 stop:2348 length:201 start_codon:yes stop_codon:yes gene_type:complete